MLYSGYILDNKYEVIKTLGKGGMSTVYLCKNLRLENFWAIKEIKKELNNNMDFLAEPNMLKKLNHPGIPRVVDVFYQDDNFYMVEDYIEGETLKDYVQNNHPLEVEDICSIASGICDIIDYLHSFKPPIIYRDLKPSNILITPAGKVKLVDFGISRSHKPNEYKDTICMGTMGYAAPEQCGLGQSCAQSDIYGLGAVMYYMISRKAPSTLVEALKDESYREDISHVLRNIIKKCMQIEAKDRYQSMKELNNEILQLLNGENDSETMIYENESTINEGNTIVCDKKAFKSEVKTVILNNERPTRQVRYLKRKKYRKIKRGLIAALICFIGIISGALFANSHDTKSKAVDSTNTAYSNDILQSDSNTPNNSTTDKTPSSSVTKEQPNNSQSTITNPQINLNNGENFNKNIKTKGKPKGKHKHD